MQEAINRGSSLKVAKNGIRKNSNWILKLKDDNGIEHFDRDMVLEIAASFYENLFKSHISDERRKELEPEINNMNDVEPVSIEELQFALSKMKKSYGRRWVFIRPVKSL